MSKRPASPARITRRGALVAAVALLMLTGIALAAVDATIIRPARTTPAAPAQLSPRDTPRTPVGGLAYPQQRSFHVTAPQPVRRVAAGRRTSFRLAIYQRKYRGLVFLRIMSRLPKGVVATLGPTPTRGRRSILRLKTSRTTPPRTYRIRVRALRIPPPGEALPLNATTDGRRHMTVRLRLIVTRRVGTAVLVNGSVTGMIAPGSSRPIDMRLGNPFGFAISVSKMTASIAHIDAVNADRAHPCSGQDFGIRDYTGPPVRLARHGLVLLSDLGVARSAWPQLVMINRPLNQDGCKGARLTLSYSAAGRRVVR